MAKTLSPSPSQRDSREEGKKKGRKNPTTQTKRFLRCEEDRRLGTDLLILCPMVPWWRRGGFRLAGRRHHAIGRCGWWRNDKKLVSRKVLSITLCIVGNVECCWADQHGNAPRVSTSRRGWLTSFSRFPCCTTCRLSSLYGSTTINNKQQHGV